MLKKIFPLIFLLIGAGIGVGAGLVLRPAPISTSEAAGETAENSEQTQTEKDVDPESEFVKMNNQFVVPIVKKEKVAALVVMSLTLEVPVGQKQPVYEKEPKLRNEFLQVLFDHANIGGFDGEFTSVDKLQILRRALKEIAQKFMGDQIKDVLITEIARQDY